MPQESPLEQPIVVHTRPAIDLDDEQFFRFCQISRDLRIERAAQGDILIMSPEGGSSGRGSSRLAALLDRWAEQECTGQVFSSSTGFNLSNGATHSPDVAWVRNERLDALSDEEPNKFLSLCPDLALELRSPSDSMRTLHRKMEEYRDNGAQLGWMLDPMNKQVQVYRPGVAAEMLDNPATVTGEQVLRGFVLEVPQIWKAMERRKS